jgi:hypothetical protein
MEHMNLMGSEDVLRAGHRMSSAAEDMNRAAASIDSTLHLFLERFERLVERLEQLAEHPNA